MLAYLRKPHPDLAALILRMGLGFLFVGYGYIKVSQTRALSELMPYNLQQAVGWAELICGGLLALGLFARLAALVLIANMIGAIILVTGRRGFFGLNVGPHGETFKPGYEYNIILIVVCLALVVLGAGWFSLDHLIFGRRRKETGVAAPLPQEPVIASTPARVGER